MKLIDGDKLKGHLDYLIQKERQLAKGCSRSPDNEFERQRRYCFEANALAYELCKNVMDYYLVADTQVMNQWISVKDRLPNIGESVLVAVIINAKLHLPFRTDFTPDIRIGWLGDNGEWGLQFDSADKDEILYWQPLPEPPQD